MSIGRENKVFTKDMPTQKELCIAEGKPISDFEKQEDKMAHVSTFIVIDGYLYITYYANTKEPSEEPLNQTARLVYAPIDREHIGIIKIDTENIENSEVVLQAKYNEGAKRLSTMKSLQGNRLYYEATTGGSTRRIRDERWFIKKAGIYTLSWRKSD